MSHLPPMQSYQGFVTTLQLVLSESRPWRVGQV
jgi:hypothetical protein